MTETRIQKKLATMPVEQATDWLLENYNGRKDNMIVIRFDGANASAPVTVNGRSTQYQVADFRHSSHEAVKTLAREHGVDVVFVVGAYWHQDYQGRGHWETSVSKYSR